MSCRPSSTLPNRACDTGESVQGDSETNPRGEAGLTRSSEEKKGASESQPEGLRSQTTMDDLVKGA